MRLLDYHESFRKGTVGLMENLLPFSLSVAKILNEGISNFERGDGVEDSAGSRVDYFIKSSVRNAFSKMLEIGGNDKIVEAEDEEASEGLLRLAKETKELATKEKENFSPVLNRWHPIAAGVAEMTLHNCYGTVLKEYLTGVSTLSNKVIGVLRRAGRLDKVLIQMVAENSVDCEDGERRAKETETWNPKSKTEPNTQSSVEMLKLAEEVVGDFFEIPIGISDDLVQELADGLESLFQDYISLVSLCRSKQSYIPTLPPLIRCNKDSRFLKLWRKASHCRVRTEESHKGGSADDHHPRPSTSHGTQRFYIRLNTLHHILSELHFLDKSLSQCPCQNPSPHNRYSNSRKHLSASPSYFDLARSSIQAASQHVLEVATFRLIFLDSNIAFYNSLYVGDVTNARIYPALRNLKQNLTFLAAIVIDRAQPLAVKEVMKASFEAFLMILLVEGSARIFLKLDHEMISEDFESLKRVF
ncbi:hypothetical protein GIB67_000590 [Kingdonia uniflora]|uniref:Uncharacterized protein n=1 Tax=Kingdonia uniflora TaxID=39325 RepID=A0A7J7P3E3_9MAGN|nr:hypothetical protein GIB67_000590 [Kingdonia uniflora]